MRFHSPMIRSTYQAAILSGISNVLAQAFQARRKAVPLHIDPFELARFVIVTLITAPPNYSWQQYLERWFPAYISPPEPPLIPMTSYNEKGILGLDEKRRDSNEEPLVAISEKRKINWLNTFMKMFIDCITLGALVNTVAFLVIMGLLKGQNWARVKVTVGKETIPLILAGYRIWPAVALLGFTLVPVERRIVFYSMFGLVWNIYMSLIAAKL